MTEFTVATIPVMAIEWVARVADKKRSHVEGVSQALAIIEEMRAAGELPAGHGFDLELATVEEFLALL